MKPSKWVVLASSAIMLGITQFASAGEFYLESGVGTSSQSIRESNGNTQTKIGSDVTHIVSSISQGYDWDVGDGWKVGEELMITFGSATSTGNINGIHYRDSAKTVLALNVRLTKQLNESVLIYGRVGPGWSSISRSISLPAATGSASRSVQGVSAGIGVEYAFKPQWAVGLEFGAFGGKKGNAPDKTDMFQGTTTINVKYTF
jgi:opacity protein-like surface antigen